MHDSGTYALHRLLSVTRQKTNNGITPAWAGTLGAAPESEDFARKMSEVGALLDETLRAVDALDNPRSREKYHRYTYSWWKAVYQPGLSWDSAATDAQFISQSHLDQLDSLAEHLAERSPRPAETPSPTDEEMQRLRDDCTEWLAWLDALDDSHLPRAQRHQLTEHFRQALWLIDNSNLFGPLHAAEAVRTATDATFVQAPGRLPAERVTELVKRWAATSLLVGQILAGPTAGVALLNQSLGAIKTGIEVFVQAGKLGLPEAPAIGPAPSEVEAPRELEAAPTGLSASSGEDQDAS